MPLTRISIRRGKPAAYKRALMAGIYAAMRETFAVPEGDRFTTIDEHDGDTFDYDESYLGVARGDDLVLIQISCRDTRDVAQKQALYAAIARNLARDPGVRPQDVLVNLVEGRKENWSFGEGIAHYV